MPDRHNAFIHDENLRNFERQLAAEEDPDKRLLLQQLLAEEKARKLPAPTAPLSTFHRVRELLIRQRTMLINALRGHLAEFGIVDPPRRCRRGHADRAGRRRRS